jgi:Ubiquitin fusion degradation protein UFD1
MSQVEGLKNQLDVEFNRPSASHLREQRLRYQREAVREDIGSAQASSSSSNANANFRAGINTLAKDKRVAIAIDGEPNSLVHFDVGQAFAWEYLRKRHRITRDDLDYAMRLQRAEEQRIASLEAERLARLERETLGDSDFARVLAQERAARSERHQMHADNDELVARMLAADASGQGALSDSQIARALAQEPEPPANRHHVGGSSDALSDSQYARLLNDDAAPVQATSTPPPPATDALTDSQFARMLTDGSLADGTPVRPVEAPAPPATDALTDSQFVRMLTDGSLADPTPVRTEPVEQPPDALSDSQFARMLADGSLETPTQTQTSVAQKWTLEATLRCFPASYADDPSAASIEMGNRVLMPRNVMAGVLVERGEPVLLEVVNINRPARQKYVAVASDSAPPGVLYASSMVTRALGLDVGDVAQVTRVHMPAARLVRFKQVRGAATPHVADALRALAARDYAAFAVGDVVPLRAADGSLLEFIVSGVEPESPALMDGAALLRIEIDAATAPEQQQQQQSTPQQPHILKVGDSPVQGTVRFGQTNYFMFEVDESARDANLLIELDALEGDPDMFVSQRTRAPSFLAFTWSATTTGGDQILVAANDAQRAVPGQFFVAVTGFEGNATFRLAVSAQRAGGAHSTAMRSATPVGERAGHQLCYNCATWVADRNFLQHEAFCLRNNFHCPVCSAVVPAAERARHSHCPRCRRLVADLAHHVHCQRCNEPIDGDGETELAKHMKIAHIPIPCACGQRLELKPLLHHQQFQCPLRTISCQHCKGFVPQHQMQSHLSACSHRPVQCPKCRQTMPAGTVPTHQCAPAASAVASAVSPSAIVNNNNSNNVTATPPGSPSWRRLSVYMCPYCRQPSSALNSLEQHIASCPSKSN